MPVMRKQDNDRPVRTLAVSGRAELAERDTSMTAANDHAVN
jgi:hypothetical protein